MFTTLLFAFLGKGKKSSAKEENLSTEKKEDGALPKVKPLQSLDIFAGCGGLSLGLHQSGVAETKWAIECYDSAAKAFKANNPNTDVFTADCNLLLKIIMEAEAEGNDGEDDLCRQTSTLVPAEINTGVTGKSLLTGNSPND